MKPPLRVRWLGRVSYGDAVALQGSLVEGRRAGAIEDTLLLLEHPPVITVGRGGDPRHVLLDDAELRRRGIERFEAGRGGDVTYHGPGQLIGYPIVALPAERRDAHRFLRDLEETLIRTACGYGLRASRAPGLTGVWVGEAKLAAIGVRLNRGWITSHGFALNVGEDLEGFRTIVPCGIGDRSVTSFARLLGRAPSLTEVAGLSAAHCARVLGLEARRALEPDERLAIPELD